MDEPVRIAMWSGPRNISTALLRAWGSRTDTAVVDEPFYAHYLLETGLDHPGRIEVLATQTTDWREVASELCGPVPGDRPVYYQKHMAHHLLEGMSGDWMDALTHCLLIRQPAEMLTSLAEVTPDPTVAGTGLPQQFALFERWTEGGRDAPPILDTRDVLEDPEGMLRALCARVRVDWDPSMLSWRAGPRSTDGVWGPYWYANVWQSTGFAPWVPKSAEVPDALQGVLTECNAIYERLHARRMRVD